APGILDGHPLGSAPMQELIQLSLRLDREAREQAGEQGLTVGGEMCGVVRRAPPPRIRGLLPDALRVYRKAFDRCQELLRTSPPHKVGTSTSNLALMNTYQASMFRTRGEVLVGMGGRSQKARESFAEAVRLHGEAIALHRRVADEPRMRDV